MTRRVVIALAAGATFSGMIVLSNYLLEHFGLLTLPLVHWSFPAGTAAAGITWPARDVLSRVCGRRWGPVVGLAAVLVGAGIAWEISATLAAASALGYLASEGTDWGLFWILGGQTREGLAYVPALSVSTIRGGHRGQLGVPVGGGDPVGRRRSGPVGREIRHHHRGGDPPVLPVARCRPAGRMIYLANPTTAPVREAISDGWLGCMASPRQANKLRPDWTWALDNDCFSEAWKASRWIAALERNHHLRHRCLFAVVPDALADPVETDRRWRIWAPVVTEFGYRPAYVLQDGATAVPWDELGALFIGGTTAYKLSAEAWSWAVEAQRRAVWVHWGRVNSRRRMAAVALAANSADGTFLTYGPTVNLRRLQSWTNTLPMGISGGWT